VVIRGEKICGKTVSLRSVFFVCVFEVPVKTLLYWKRSDCSFFV